jgi:hypothetical protein
MFALKSIDFNPFDVRRSQAVASIHTKHVQLTTTKGGFAPTDHDGTR